MNRSFSLISAAILLVMLTAGVGIAQESAAFTSTEPTAALTAKDDQTRKKFDFETEDEKKKKLKADEEAEAAKAAKAQNNTECRMCRWIDLQTATVAFRYRWVRSNQPVTANMVKTQPFLTEGEYIKINQGQQQQIYEFDFKFDRAGRYKIHTRLSSGAWFTRSFAEVGAGDEFNGEKGWKVLPRQFYFSAEPVKGVEFQYGGLGINRGENTEHTTYDNDGFITGQRVTVKRPDKIWLSEVSVTYAYIGDFYKPNFFARAKRLNESNYHQFLVGKKFGKRMGVSVDYTSHASISHLRQGVSVNTPELKFIKSLRADFYQRIEEYRGVKKDWGYNFQAEMNFGGKLELTAGIADTDYNYNVLTHEKYPARQALATQPAGTLTADRMIRGLSPFASWKYKVSPYFSFFGFATVDLNKPTPLPFVYNADHFSVGVQVDFGKMLKKNNIF